MCWLTPRRQQDTLVDTIAANGTIAPNDRQQVGKMPTGSLGPSEQKARLPSWCSLMLMFE